MSFHIEETESMKRAEKFINRMPHPKGEVYRDNDSIESFIETIHRLEREKLELKKRN